MAIADKPQLKAFLINTLRRAGYRWHGRYTALKKAKIGRNEYVCASCGLIHGRRDGQMDHIYPVVDPIEGWVNLDVWAERMFVEEDMFQRLCTSCHDDKSGKEVIIRKENRKPRKKKNKA